MRVDCVELPILLLVWAWMPAQEVSACIPGSKSDSRRGNANACNGCATSRPHPAWANALSAPLQSGTEPHRAVVETPEGLSNGQRPVSQFQSFHDAHKRGPDSFRPTSRLRLGCCDTNPPDDNPERYTRSYLDSAPRNRSEPSEWKLCWGGSPGHTGTGQAT